MGNRRITEKRKPRYVCASSSGSLQFDEDGLEIFPSKRQVWARSTGAASSHVRRTVFMCGYDFLDVESLSIESGFGPHVVSRVLKDMVMEGVLTGPMGILDYGLEYHGKHNERFSLVDDTWCTEIEIRGAGKTIRCSTNIYIDNHFTHAEKVRYYTANRKLTHSKASKATITPIKSWDGICYHMDRHHGTVVKAMADVDIAWRDGGLVDTRFDGAEVYSPPPAKLIRFFVKSRTCKKCGEYVSGRKHKQKVCNEYIVASVMKI